MASSSFSSIPRLLFDVLVFSQIFFIYTAHATNTATEAVESVFFTADDLGNVKYVVPITALLLGAIVYTGGDKSLGLLTFVGGFIGGGYLVAWLIEDNITRDRMWLVNMSWLSFCVGGLICGCITAACSIFVAGCVWGVMLAALIYALFGYKCYPSDPEVAFIFLVTMLGLAAGVLAMQLWKEPVAIVTTSAAGAWLLISGAGYFIGDYPNGADLRQTWRSHKFVDWFGAIRDVWWAYLGAIIVLTVIGVVVQIYKKKREREERYYSRQMNSLPPHHPVYYEAPTSPVRHTSNQPPTQPPPSRWYSGGVV